MTAIPAAPAAGAGTGRPGWGPTASRTVTWHDPLATAAAGAQLAGLEHIRAMFSGELPPPPICDLFRITGVSAEPGVVVFTAEPDASMYNPIGMIHGGLVCTLLDSALGCAAHTTLPQGTAYTSIDINVSYLRPVTVDSGPLVAHGRVVKPGRRVCFTAGEVVDAAGRTVATATSSLLIFPLE